MADWRNARPTSRWSRRQWILAAATVPLAPALMPLRALAADSPPPPAPPAQAAVDLGLPAEKVDWSALKVVNAEVPGPEGPTALADGSIVMVAYVDLAIVRIYPDGRKETLAKTDPATVGTALGHDGKIYAAKLNPARFGPASGPGANESPGSIASLDLKTHELHTLYTSCQGEDFRAPDDLVVDHWGDLWVTDTGAGCVYCAQADGSKIEKVLDGAAGVNGITLSPDSKTLYVVGNKMLVAYRIIGRGKLAQQGGKAAGQALLTWPDGIESPDGMRMEASGKLILGCGRDGIIVCSPNGKLLSQTKPPGYGVTSMVFGGKDLKTLYLAASQNGDRNHGALLTISWPRAGAKLW